MRLPETETEYRNALVDAAELGATRALEKADLIKPFLTVRAAQRKYGPAVVNRWIREGLIKVSKDGTGSASKRIDRVGIEAVARADNRSTYLNTKERTEKSNN